MSGQIQMPAPAAQLAAALVVAQGAVEEAAKDGRNPDDGYTYATADELVRVGKAALKVAGLALLPCSSDIVAGQGGGADLMRGFMLLHSSGASMPITIRWPVPSDKARDKAAASAYTSSLGYVMRDLLAIPRVMAGEEPMDARREKAGATSSRFVAAEEDSDGGPVRTELLPPGYRANTRVWTMREIRAEVEKETRSREGCACTTGTVYIDDACYYRARWSTARKTPWGSVSWLAWRTSTLEPAEFSCRRWTKVSGDWPVHPDDPKPEADTRPIEEVLGDTLPDIAPAKVQPVRDLGSSHIVCRGECGDYDPHLRTEYCTERMARLTPDPAAGSPVATPDSPAACGGGALSPDSSTATTGTPIHDLPPVGCPSIESTPAGAVPVGTHNKPQRDASTVEALVANDPVKPNPLGLSSGRRNGVSSGLPSPVEPPKGSAHPPDPSPVEPAGDVPLVVDVPGGAAPPGEDDGPPSRCAECDCPLAADSSTCPDPDCAAAAEAVANMIAEAVAYTGPCGDCKKPQSECACDFGPVQPPLIEPSSEALAALEVVIAKRKAAAVDGAESRYLRGAEWARYRVVSVRSHKGTRLCVECGESLDPGDRAHDGSQPIVAPGVETAPRRAREWCHTICQIDLVQGRDPRAAQEVTT